MAKAKLFSRASGKCWWDCPGPVTHLIACCFLPCSAGPVARARLFRRASGKGKVGLSWTHHTHHSLLFLALFSGASGKGKVGLSWIAGVCRKNYRCTAVFPNGFKFTTELHEFGHR